MRRVNVDHRVLAGDRLHECESDTAVRVGRRDVGVFPATEGEIDFLGRGVKIDGGDNSRRHDPTDGNARTACEGIHRNLTRHTGRRVAIWFEEDELVVEDFELSGDAVHGHLDSFRSLHVKRERRRTTALQK